MSLRLSLLALVVPALLTLAPQLHAAGIDPSPWPPRVNRDLELTGADVRYLEDLDHFVFELRVRGEAGATVPRPRGQLDGAPVLGYVVPTTLKAEDVGFSPTEGIVALAITSHPDFDDTPLWDEDLDADYENDGKIFHTHWVVLTKDARVPGGLAVKQFKKGDATVHLPPTNPGMPMYMDSPGHPVQLRGRILRVVVPAVRMGRKTSFKFDAVSAYMQVNTSDPNRPMLGVYNLYKVLSGNLSLPYSVRSE